MDQPSNAIIFFIPSGILILASLYFFVSGITIGGCIMLIFACGFVAVGRAVRKRERLAK